ncbi:FAD-dependent pyridine nucleotide-disulfide oxidoreductase family protein [Syntrophotalea carbinolica DSM 2380]|uniref:FAD-dependent pyridine nucleotide-disulfide oxidoreductase family protein n=1 Tax=Syntrophotalea carbinolica (strain DSM 2380 / NBRC 103641 / GraBd1) TaxID=338963 RepID=Q3A666_SYNC1|nr:FAD-dependent oxidoreductase [Syntrophotalea carbinolica]ABA88141.1 FAD-dependent pyridine nucleotide-disulfide oxidoreductase family protein [Syntrophotalea carbinolica DSM 2380]
MKHLIIGNSAAGTAAAEAIRENDPTAEIVMLSKDATFFSRCQLHLVASGKRPSAKTRFVPQNWAEHYGIEVRFGQHATAVNALQKKVLCSHGENIDYDRLLLATGASSLTPPIEGIEGPGVFGLRNLEDAEGIYKQIMGRRHVAIIGAGLVGCELAEALVEAGHTSVTIIEIAPHPLPLQLEERTGERMLRLMVDHGIDMICRDSVTAILRDSQGEPTAVRLKTGREIPADLVVCAAGVRPNIDLFAPLGAIGHRGIVIDSGGRTSVPDIFAAGDVTESCDSTVGRVMPSAIWPAARRQGRVAGINMSGGDESLTEHTGLKTSAVLCGTPLVSLGPVFDPHPSWQKQIYEHTDSRGRLCTKVCYSDQNGSLAAAVLWGDISLSGLYAEAIIHKHPLGDLAPSAIPDYRLQAVV